MSKLQIDNDEEDNQVLIEEDESNYQHLVDNTPSLSTKILRVAGSTAYSLARSKLGRHVILSGVLYCAGSTLVASVGLGPVVLASVAMSLL